MNRKMISGEHPFKMLLIGIVIVAGFSAVVMLLWNLLLPQILGLSTINYWQSAGLFILTRILFGSFGGGNPNKRPMHDFHRGNPIHDKWMKMSPEQREEFIKKRMDFMHQRFGRREGFFRGNFDNTRDK